MKFLGKKLIGTLVSTLFIGLALPAQGQEPAFTPAVSPTYLDGYAPLALPRAQATASGTEYSAPPNAEQNAEAPTMQISDAPQDPVLSGVLQTAFAGKPQDVQQQLPTAAQQFAKSYEAPAPIPVVQSAVKPASASASLLQQTAQSCDTTSAPACAQPAACCCASPFEHRCGLFADYLCLRAFDVDMAHGTQQNGALGAGTVPAGDVGVAQPQFESGFRVGGDWACSCCSDVRVTYTWYQSSTSNLLEAAPGVGGTTASLVLFPGASTTASTFSSLFATYDIDFQTVDIDYCFQIDHSDNAAWNFSVGTRYGHLEQDFSQLAEASGATGSQHTFTSIGFDGVGLRTGLDGEREFGDSRLALYGKGFLSVLFGQFDSGYTQVDVVTSTVEANSHWKDARVLPILETEVGLQWTSCNDHWKLGAGYYTAYWFNAVDTAEFIQAVQSESFTRVGHAIVFTGLTAHAEYCF